MLRPALAAQGLQGLLRPALAAQGLQGFFRFPFFGLQGFWACAAGKMENNGLAAKSMAAAAIHTPAMDTTPPRARRHFNRDIWDLLIIGCDTSPAIFRGFATWALMNSSPAVRFPEKGGGPIKKKALIRPYLDGWDGCPSRPFRNRLPGEPTLDWLWLLQSIGIMAVNNPTYFTI
ncbi:MAG: hypothetical protein IIC64_15040 [SAR324 cluster bacterium]|nr:hypothetical protein [SAR324 cluster bacterium]